MSGLLPSKVVKWAAGLLFPQQAGCQQPGPQAAVQTEPAVAAVRQRVFSIRGLTRVYGSPCGPVKAVDGLSLEIESGITAIVGPSGGGKTTLLNCIGGLDVPTSGDVWFYSQQLDFDNAEAMRRHRANGVAWVFQELNLIGHQTAVENVALPLFCRGVSRRDALLIAQKKLDDFSIGHLARRSREQLSRGQQQRVAIARAFVSQGAVVLADEPTGSLDPESAETVMQAFRQMSQIEGKPVVLVTHNLNLARRYCDRILMCPPAVSIKPITQPPEQLNACATDKPAHPAETRKDA